MVRCIGQWKSRKENHVGSNGQKNVAGTELSFCFKMASSEGAEVMTIRIPKKSDELAVSGQARCRKQHFEYF